MVLIKCLLDKISPRWYIPATHLCTVCQIISSAPAVYILCLIVSEIQIYLIHSPINNVLIIVSFLTPSAKARVYIEEYVSVLHCLFFDSKNVKSKSYRVSVKFMSLCSDRCQLTNTHPDRDLHLSLCIVVSSYIML